MLDRKENETATRRDHEWLTVREFTERYKLGKNLVYESVRDSRIPSIRVGGKILIPSDALDRLLEDRNTNE